MYDIMDIDHISLTLKLAELASIAEDDAREKIRESVQAVYDSNPLVFEEQSVDECTDEMFKWLFGKVAVALEGQQFIESLYHQPLSGTNNRQDD